MKLPWRDSSDQPKQSAPNEVAARMADAAAGRNTPPPHAPTTPARSMGQSAKQTPVNSAPPTEATYYAEAYFSHNPEQAHSIVEQGHRRAIPLSFLLMALVLVASVSIFYYNFVFTAQPSYLWKTALTRSNNSFDHLINYGIDESQAATVKGTYKAEGSVNLSGDLNMDFYKGSANFTANIGQLPNRAIVVGKIIDVPSSDNPDVYFRATGLKNVIDAAPDYAQSLLSYDNQWFSVDHTLFDNLASKAIKQKNANVQLTPAQLRSGAAAMSTINKQYIFTSDAQKSVFNRVTKVGKEHRDGRSVYHYRVGLNRAHTKAYVTDLASALQKTPFANVTTTKQVRDAVDFNGLLKNIEGINATSRADVYVDTSTKLISAIRFTNKASKDNFLEIGFPYLGKSHTTLHVLVHNTKDGKTSDMDLLLNLDNLHKTMQINLSTASKPTQTTGQKLVAIISLAPGTQKLSVGRPLQAQSLLAAAAAAPTQGKTVGDLFSSFAVTVTPGKLDPVKNNVNDDPEGIDAGDEGTTESGDADEPDFEGLEGSGDDSGDTGSIDDTEDNFGDSSDNCADPSGC